MDKHISKKLKKAFQLSNESEDYDNLVDNMSLMEALLIQIGMVQHELSNTISERTELHRSILSKNFNFTPSINDLVIFDKYNAKLLVYSLGPLSSGSIGQFGLGGNDAE